MTRFSLIKSQNHHCFRVGRNYTCTYTSAFSAAVLMMMTGDLPNSICPAVWPAFENGLIIRFANEMEMPLLELADGKLGKRTSLAET